MVKVIAVARWVTGFIREHPLLATLVAVRLTLVATYPLNLMLADGRDYIAMLVEGRSSLIHAPGYPFLLGLPWRNPLGRLLIEGNPLLFERLLLVSQHALNLACLALGYRVVRELFGRLPANLFLLAYGLHYQVLSLTSSATPEWLQGSLLMVLAYLVVSAARTEAPRRKLVLWGLAGLVFAWMYLVKFNSLALALLPAAVAAWEVWRSRRAWRWLAAGGLVAVATYLSFLALVHRPSTGTWSVTLDKAWVLLHRLSFFAPGETLDPAAGIHTRRLLVLNSLLPWPESLRPIAHVDWVPASERAPYRERYAHLLTADDATLEPLLDQVKVPRPYDLNRAFLPIATHLGLPESNRLGAAVFFEHVRAFPREYVRSVWRLTWRTMTTPKRPWMYPVNLSSPGGTPLGWGFLELPARPGSRTEWRYTRPVVWGPGVRAFTLHFDLLQIPPLWFTLVIASGAVVAVVRGFRRRRLDLAGAAYLVTAATLLAFIVASNLAYHFRWKELGAVMPLVTVLVSVSVAGWARWMVGCVPADPGGPSGDGAARPGPRAAAMVTGSQM